jgi:hypothetical protein
MITDNIRTMMDEGFTESWHYGTGYKSAGSKPEFYFKLHHPGLQGHYAEGSGISYAAALNALAGSAHNILEMLKWQSIPNLPKVEVKGRHALKIRGRTHLPRQFMEAIKKNEDAPVIIFSLVRGETGMVFRMTIREDEWVVKDVQEITNPDMEAVTKFFKLHKQSIP